MAQPGNIPYTPDPPPELPSIKNMDPELANYLRIIWGGQKPDVTAAAVRALR